MHFQQVTWMELHQASTWWHISLNYLSTTWLQNLILVATAAIGILTFRSSSHQERRRATVDVLLHTLDDAEFQKARAQALALLKAGLDIPNLLSEAGLPDRKILLHVLSRYEFIATGVREGAFDAKIYKRMYYTNVIADWDRLETFVRELRMDRNNNTPFQELQRLVREWKRRPLRAYYKPPTQASQTVTLTVTAAATPTFTLSVLPASVSVAKGSDGTSTISTTAESGFDSAVGLTASGQPRGVTVSFSPATVAAPGSGKSTMKMAVASTTAPGTYPITVTGTGGWFRRRLRLIFRRVKALYSRLRHHA